MQKKKRVLKSWVQKGLSAIVGFGLCWFCTTIDTIDLPFNQIKGYLVASSIILLLMVVSMYLLMKYTNLFEEE
jgi:hypothetical protein